MGRTLTITIHSARDLLNADGDEYGETDAFVVACFDGDVSRELGRTEVAPETSSPEWEHTFDVDVTKHISTVVEETGSEPNKLTFCLFDGDETEVEPIGVAGVDFSDLVKAGKFDGDVPIVQGSGNISVTIDMKKVKKGSMLKDSTALKVAGGVAGTAALGAVGAYLFKRYEAKKEKLGEEAQGEDGGEDGEDGGDATRTGFAYGANIGQNDEEGEDGDDLKQWWEMDDEEDDDDEENRWGDEADAY